MDIDKYIRITCQNGQVLTANARDVCSCITKDKSKTCKNYACAHGKDCGIFRRTTCVPFHTRYRNKMEKDRSHVLSHHCADLMSMDNFDVKISSKQRQLRRKEKIIGAIIVRIYYIKEYFIRKLVDDYNRQRYGENLNCLVKKENECGVRFFDSLEDEEDDDILKINRHYDCLEDYLKIVILTRLGLNDKDYVKIYRSIRSIIKKIYGSEICEQWLGSGVRNGNRIKFKEIYETLRKKHSFLTDEIYDSDFFHFSRIYGVNEILDNVRDELKDFC